MTADPRPGDLVLVGDGGRLFYARVTGRAMGGGLAITPLDRTVRARHAALADVRDVWHHAARAEGRPPAGQLTLLES